MNTDELISAKIFLFNYLKKRISVEKRNKKNFQQGNNAKRVQNDIHTHYLDTTFFYSLQKIHNTTKMREHSTGKSFHTYKKYCKIM